MNYSETMLQLTFFNPLLSPSALPPSHPAFKIVSQYMIRISVQFDV